VTTPSSKKYWFFSLSLHLLVLFILLFELDWTSTMPVIENTNQHDVISAVILGDTAKSKILPHPAPPPPPPPPSAPVVQKMQPAPVIEKDVIALKPPKPVKIQPKKQIKKMPLQKNLFAKDLLQDMKTQTDKSVQSPSKTNSFQALLKQQAEKSLRQSLLKEDIKLQATAAHASSGVVNKYQALILQAIGQQWAVPPGVDQSLHCVLLIRLAPGGTVLDVEISQTSGSSELDRSARAAVMKASPLPVPPAAQDFEPFRQFELNVRPKDIVDAG